MGRRNCQLTQPYPEGRWFRVGQAPSQKAKIAPLRQIALRAFYKRQEKGWQGLARAGKDAPEAIKGRPNKPERPTEQFQTAKRAGQVSWL